MFFKVEGNGNSQSRGSNGNGNYHQTIESQFQKNDFPNAQAGPSQKFIEKSDQVGGKNGDKALKELPGVNMDMNESSTNTDSAFEQY